MEIYKECEKIKEQIKDYAFEVYGVDLDDLCSISESSAITLICQGLYEATELVGHCPADDVRSERYSEWVERNGIFECKECGYSFEHEGYVHFFIYCPCCGAKMGISHENTAAN